MLIDTQLHFQVNLIVICAIACRDTNLTVFESGECLVGDHAEGVRFFESFVVLGNRYGEMCLGRGEKSCMELNLCYSYYQRCAIIMFLFVHF